MVATADPRPSTPPRSPARPSPPAHMPRSRSRVVAVMLAAGIATGALWSPLDSSGLMHRLAYGLPALEAHRWWTPVTGSFLAADPAAVPPGRRRASSCWSGSRNCGWARAGPRW